MSVKDVKIQASLDQSGETFAQRNPQSEAINRHAADYLPGGTTRNVVFMKPFPVVMAGGEGSYLTDVDGHRYLDLCGEYSAGMFGHSHPIIVKAMHDAIDAGVALGSVNQYEGRLGELIVKRFPSIDKVRFSNSGTEAVTTCLALIRAYTSKNTFVVFKGGYHGGLAAFSSEKENNMADSGTKTMNVPYNFVKADYNDPESMRRVVDEHRGDVAAIIVEAMQGSSGCIPADIDFLQACRDKATEIGCVFMMDEVMTSRMSIGGYQSLLKITPDMTTLGKYMAGGGCNFGAFGGRADIMAMLEPGLPGGVYHSGTYNNNVVGMASAVAALEKVWTAEAAQELWDIGVWFRNALNALSEKHNSALYVSGTGSIMSVHFTGKPVRNSVDVQAGNALLKEFFFLEMLKKGFFIARRGMISLLITHTKEQLQTFIDAVEEFLVENKELASK